MLEKIKREIIKFINKYKQLFNRRKVMLYQCPNCFSRFVFGMNEFVATCSKCGKGKLILKHEQKLKWIYYVCLWRIKNIFFNNWMIGVYITLFTTILTLELGDKYKIWKSATKSKIDESFYSYKDPYEAEQQIIIFREIYGNE